MSSLTFIDHVCDVIRVSDHAGQPSNCHRSHITQPACYKLEVIHGLKLVLMVITKLKLRCFPPVPVVTFIENNLILKLGIEQVTQSQLITVYGIYTKTKLWNRRSDGAIVKMYRDFRLSDQKVT